MKLVNLTCPNCSGAMKKEGENIVCQSCGAVFAIDYDDADVEHEKLQTEDERAKREFEHEKELLEIRHRQEEEARIAAEKRESKRAVKAKIGRSISAKISGLIGLLIVVGFFYGSYKLCVHWGVVPPMKEIIASATANGAPNYDVPVEAITDEVLENMISAGRSTKLSTRSNRNIKDYANGEWIEYTLSEVELDSAYFIDNASELAPLTKTEVMQVLMRIQEFHGKAYDWHPDVSAETLYKATEAGGYLLRTKLRATIEFFDQLYQYGEAGETKISELGKETFNEEEDIPELDGLEQMAF